MFAISDMHGYLNANKGDLSLLLAAGGVGLFVAFAFYRVFFEDFSDFWKRVKIFLALALIPPFRDGWSDLKLQAWFWLSVGAVISAFYGLPKTFPDLFHVAHT